MDLTHPVNICRVHGLLMLNSFETSMPSCFFFASFWRSQLMFILLWSLRRHQRQIKSVHVCRRDPLKTTIQWQNRFAFTFTWCVTSLYWSTAYLYVGGHFPTLMYSADPRPLLFSISCWSTRLAVAEETERFTVQSLVLFCQRCLFERAFAPGWFE